MKTLGIVCARAGSRRLPDKNVLDLCGKPMALWSIEAACRSRLDAVVVSSDSLEVLRAARPCRALPVLRPGDLAGDTSPIVDALIHAYLPFEKVFSHVMLLQASSPLRTEGHVNWALDVAELEHPESLVTRGPSGRNNGCIYLVTARMLVERRVLWDDKTRVVTQDETMVDVDTREDFERARSLMERRVGSGVP